MRREFDIAEYEAKENVTTVATKKIGHVIILLMLFFILAVIFCAVWQSGVNRSLEMKKTQLLASIYDLEEQHRTLRSDIASQTMPEAIVEDALVRDISFEQIEASGLLLVARGD